MISAEQITEAFDDATRQFRQSDEYQELIAGGANLEVAREFLRNVFRTHFLSSHIVALCFASLPSTAAEMLRENLLEEMGRSDDEKPHSALLLELARRWLQPERDRRVDRRCAPAPCGLLRNSNAGFNPARALPGGAARNHEV